TSQKEAHHFLAEADWLMITLGSAFVYKLAETNEPVANCHRASAQIFNKHLCSINEIIAALDNTIHQLFNFNPKIKIIFTISPVRHIRDGVIDNNRSKARLIEAVHHLINKFEKLYYFPAYELVIDVLRDYRFCDIDLVHPNYAATEFVLEKFTESCLNEETRNVMAEIKKIMIAKKHKAFNPQSQQHKQFLQRFYAKTLELQERYSGLNFDEELKYFAG
ncbi:MAG: GSCFA domain-containing protein, partial [Parafilimonas sp.]